MEQPNAIVCVRVKETPAHMIADGSIKHRCAKCSEEVWISPATQRMLAADSALAILCIYCVPKETTKISLTAEHIQEFLSWRIKNRKN